MPTIFVTGEDNRRIIKRIAVVHPCNTKLKQNRFKLARSEKKQ